MSKIVYCIMGRIDGWTNEHYFVEVVDKLDMECTFDIFSDILTDAEITPTKSKDSKDGESLFKSALI